MVITLSVVILSACTKDSIKNQDLESKPEQNQQVKDNYDKADNIDKAASTNDTKVSENTQTPDPTSAVTKIKGRKKYLEKLGNIQKELDTLPEKKDSDAGVTNAMRNYYGKSYETYDKELNEIYALLKKQLSQETMKDLQAKQIKWIKTKEAAADKEASQYKGGTFEFVAFNISLYESTKQRCYELVNEYMTD